MASEKPGLYNSDVEGHVLLLERDPTRVTCVICKETTPAKKEEAAAFTAKHGYLSRIWLGDSVESYLHRRLGLTPEKINQILLSDIGKHWIVEIFKPSKFDM